MERVKGGDIGQIAKAWLQFIGFMNNFVIKEMMIPESDLFLSFEVRLMDYSFPLIM